MELYKLFEEHYTVHESIIDDTAERINQREDKTMGAFKECYELTNQTENPNVYPNQNK